MPLVGARDEGSEDRQEGSRYPAMEVRNYLHFGQNEFDFLE